MYNYIIKQTTNNTMKDSSNTPKIITFSDKTVNFVMIVASSEDKPQGYNTEEEAEEAGKIEAEFWDTDYQVWPIEEHIETFGQPEIVKA